MQPRILFFDIETSPCTGWFWRSGYNQTISYDQILEPGKIIMISYKWGHEDRVVNLKWSKASKQCDKALLKAFSKEINKADAVVYHNGDRFDLPWVNTRLLKHGLDPLDPVISEDTLKLAKRKFFFPSNRLDALGEYLGVGRKLRTGGADLWKDICFNKDDEALKYMAEYCNQDVILLEKVYHKLAPHTDRRLSYYGPDKCRDCGHIGFIHNKTSFTKAGSERVAIKCTCCKKCRTVSGAAYRRLLGE